MMMMKEAESTVFDLEWILPLQLLFGYGVGGGRGHGFTVRRGGVGYVRRGGGRRPWRETPRREEEGEDDFARETGDGAHARRRRRRGGLAGAPEQGAVAAEAFSSSGGSGTWRNSRGSGTWRKNSDPAMEEGDLLAPTPMERKEERAAQAGKCSDELKEEVSVVELVEVVSLVS
ncbi:hypothetical protein Syun_020768 [Stephania yunnanensis]|uniref:Uncharacterized protein n=1 Tax=Stephania yunnanensis TaxID=152371 RepID=A0AAP0IFQ7_9MAGN